MSREKIIEDIRIYVADAFREFIRSKEYIRTTDEARISISSDISGVYVDLDYEVEAGVVKNFVPLYVAINNNSNFCRSEALAEAKEAAKIAAEMYDLPLKM